MKIIFTTAPESDPSGQTEPKLSSAPLLYFIYVKFGF